MKEEQCEDAAGCNPGCDVDVNYTFHGAEMWEYEENADYPKQACAQQRNQHRADCIAHSVAAAGEGFCQTVEYVERCHHLHVGDDQRNDLSCVSGGDEERTKWARDEEKGQTDDSYCKEGHSGSNEGTPEDTIISVGTSIL